MSTATATKERPILFNGEMVRAILDGRKTQTRRVLTPQPVYNSRKQLPWSWTPKGRDKPVREWARDHAPARNECWHCGFAARYSPFGVPGDRLWVRETWAPRCDFDPDEMGYDYAADFNRPVHWKWKPSIHMPRKVSRITLEITDVRVEQLRAISEADAIAEGTAEIFPDPASSHMNIYRPVVGPQPLCGTLANATECFAQAWIEIYGLASWQETPWVWVYEFKRAEAVEASASEVGGK